MMGKLTADRFVEFYQAVHSRSPHPWQLRLAKEVIEEERWPKDINIPTGCGKTSCIDIAVYALACCPEKNPRRIVYVVNRRVVVDAAHENAQLIERKIKCAQDGILVEVREQLRDMSCGGTPVKPVLMRGGTHIDKEWDANPAQPCVISTTVDQAGSRILFRGYGVGDLSRIVEAGLLGYDCLWLLDETHISQPFTTTLRTVEEYRGSPWSKKQMSRPWSIVEMTATPTGRQSSGFELDKDDRRSDILSAVLGAAKMCELVKSKAKDSNDHEVLAADLVERARSLYTDFSCTEIAVVVNRVATAKIAYDKLRSYGETHLLTGRMRSWDRDLNLSRLGRFRTDNKRKNSNNEDMENHESAVTFVVSTQCLEVGADLDFDGMVSEASSIDSLRQRFGRLNRSGKRDPCRGFIVAPASVYKRKNDSSSDPVYGDAAAKTWEFLARDGKNIDFGIDAISNKLKDATEDMALAPPDSPKLLPSHLDLLCQTRRHLLADPDIAPFLHGFGRGVPEVSVVWRAGLPDGDRFKDRCGEFVNTLNALPPRSGESMRIRLWIMRRYLDTGDVRSNAESDAEWERLDDDRQDSGADRHNPPIAFVWRGKNDVRLIIPDKKSKQHEKLKANAKALDLEYVKVNDIRSNDVVVLSASDESWKHLGNMDANVAEHSNVAIDIAEKVAFVSTGGLVLKEGNECDHSAENHHLYKLQGRITVRMANDNRYPFCMTDAARKFKNAIDDHELELAKKIEYEALEKLPALAFELAEKTHHSHIADVGHILTNTHHKSLENIRGSIDLESIKCRMEVMEDGGVLLEVWGKDSTHRPEIDPRLDKHMSGVATMVERYSNALGLGKNDGLIETLITAALLHDAGKADVRFQQMLHRSIVPLPVGSELLAKDNGKRRLKHKHYPAKFRHELVSSRLAESVEVPDRDLFLHLIESHHGHCRPNAPAVKDDGAEPVEYIFKGKALRASPATELEKVGSGAASRFWSCTRTYGWWGLAWVTSIFLLADWGVSGGKS